MKIYQLIAAAALTAVSMTLGSCGNTDNYPDMLERQVVIKADGSAASELTLKAGETVVLTGEIQPLYTDEGELTWSSSDESVATVETDEETGVVTLTGVNDGTAEVTAVEDRKPVFATGRLVVTVTNGSVVVSDDPVDQGLAEAPRK